MKKLLCRALSLLAVLAVLCAGMAALADGDDAVSINVSETSVTTHQPVHVTASADGADAMTLYLFNRDDEIEDERHADAASIEEDFGGWGERTYYEIVAVAHYGEEAVTSESVHIDVTADGFTNPPRFTNAPTAHSMNTDYTFDFSSPDAEWVYADLHYIGDEGWEWRGAEDVDLDEKGEARYTFIADCFDAAGMYRIALFANAEGKESGESVHWVYVPDSKPEVGVDLRVNGEREAAEMQTREEAWIELDADGATAYRVLREGEWDYWDNPDDIVDGHLEFDAYYGEAGSYGVYAEACFEEFDRDAEGYDPAQLNYSAGSNLVELRVNADSGWLPYPQAELSAYEVAQGEELTLNITPTEDIGEWYWMDLSLRRYDDEGNAWWDYAFSMDWNEEENCIRIPTGVMLPGEYQMYLFNGKEGYVSSQTSLRFLITGEAEERIAVETDRDSVVTDGQFYATVLATGANWVQLRATRDGDPGWEDYWDEDGENRSFGLSFGEPDIYHLTPVGYYEGEEEGREGETIDIEVYSLGTLDAPVIHIPAVIELNQPLKVSIDPVENANHYHLTLEHRPADRDGYDIDDRIIGEDTEYEYESGFFDEPGIFNVRVYVDGPGYEANWAEATVLVVDPESYTENEVSLTVNGSDEDQIVVNTHETVNIHVDAPEATAIRVKDGEGWDYRWRERDDDGDGMYEDYDWSFGYGTANIVAQARYDAFWDYEDFDLQGDDYGWTAVSNAVEVTAVAPNGRLPEPVGELSADDVPQGETMTLSITPIEDVDEWYWIDVDMAFYDDEGNADWQHRFSLGWNEAESSIRIPTGAMTPGDYQLDLHNNAEGYIGSETELRFCITGEGERIAAEADRDSALINEDFSVTVLATGAEWVELRATRDGDPDWWDTWDNDGENREFDLRFDEPDIYHFTPIGHYEGEEEGREGETIDFEVYSNGVLDAPVIHIPAVIDLNTPLKVSFDPVENADNYDLHMEYRPVSRDWEDIDDRSIGGDTEFEYESGFFDEPGIFMVRVYANGYGYEGSESEASVVVVDPENRTDNEVSLTVNRSDEDLTVNTHEKVRVHVDAPEATAIRVLNGDWDCRWRDRDDDRDGMYEDYDWSFDCGTVNIVAQARYDAFWDYEDFDLYSDEGGWTAVSNAVTVTAIAPNGRLPEPVGALSADEVAQDEALTLSITPTEDKGEWYWADFDIRVYEGDEGDSRWDYRFSLDWNEAERSIRIPTGAMTPGEYRLFLHNNAEGYIGSETQLRFILNGEGERIVAQADRDDGLINDDFTITVLATGAEWVELRATRDGDPDWWDTWDHGGENREFNLSFDQPDTYHFTPIGHYDGEEEGREGETIDFELRSLGTLPVPIVRLPATIDLNTPLKGSIDPVENAESYDLHMEYRPVSRDWEDIDDRSIGGDTEFEYESYFFDEPGIFMVRAYAHAAGYEGSEGETTVLVVDPEKQSEHEVSLTVNGSKEEQALLMSQRVRVVVEAPEATAIRVWNNGWDYREWQDSGNDVENFDWTFDEGIVNVVAQARYDRFWEGEAPVDIYADEAGWTAVSNAVKVTVTAPYGKLDDPVASVDERVTRGEFLNVHFDAVENAEKYNIVIDAEDENGEYRGNRYYAVVTEAGDYQLPTANLTDEFNYLVYVGSVAKGYQNGHSGNIGFAVDQPEKLETELKFAKLEAQTCEVIGVSVTAPGANGIRLGRDGMGEIWAERDGDSMAFDLRCNNASVYHFIAYATYDGGETWKTVGEEDLTITAPNGGIDLPTVTVSPAQPKVGEDVTITISRPKNGDWCSVNIENARTGERIYDRGESLEILGQMTIVLPADQLQANQAYRVDVSVDAGTKGYDGSHIQTEFTVGEATQSAKLEVSKTELKWHEHFTVTASAPGATMMQVYKGNGDWQEFDGDQLEAVGEIAQTGSFKIYARYTTDPNMALDKIDLSTIDWNSVNWTGMTNTVTVNVAAPSKALDVPAVALEKDTVTQGEVFVAKITKPVEGEWYGVNAFRLGDDGEEWTEYYHWDEEAESVYLPTLDMEPGEYTLCVQNMAVDSEGNQARFPVTVKPAESLTVGVGKTAVVTQQSETIYAMAPGAEQIHVKVYNADDAENVFYDESVEGDRFEDSTNFGGHAGKAIIEAVATKAGGQQETKQLEITVTAPNGDIAIEENAPEILMMGDALEFGIGAEHAAWIDVNITDVETGETVFSDDGNTDDWTYKFEAGRFAVGKVYQIHVYAAAYGYNDVNYDTWFAVVDPARVLTLPAALKRVEAEAFSGIDAQMVVLPDGATYVDAKAFTGSKSLVAIVAPAELKLDPAALEGTVSHLIVAEPKKDAAGE